MSRRFLLPALAALVLLGTAPREHASVTGSFKIDVPAGPFVSGSRLAVTSSGAVGPVSYSVLGPGRIEGGEYVAPTVTQRTAAILIGSARGAIAERRIEIVPAPRAGQPLLAVATYRNGIALHDPRTLRLIGFVPIGGAPGDVTFGRDGSIFAPDTDSDVLASVLRAPWSIRVTHGVALGNEVAVEEASGNVFVTNRDAGGFGALTRISPQGDVARVKTGDVAEGLAIDPKLGLAYVGDVNSRNVAVVNARTMRLIRTIPSVERTFGIALDTKAQRLFVVSNTSPSMPTHGGYVAAIDLRLAAPHIVMRSARMIFPLGIALDERLGRLFVTDEAANAVYVLSAKTLRPVHPPLSTCDTPWRPRIASNRLYVPCANADKVDVFDIRSLHRIDGAPFATGGYPLGVALWRR